MDDMSLKFPLERYLLFSGADYYARGGCWDLTGSYPTQLEANAAAREVVRGDMDVQWAQVLDAYTGKTTAFSLRHKDHPVVTEKPDYYYEDTTGLFTGWFRLRGV